MQYEEIELIIQDSETGTIFNVSELISKIETSKSIDNSAGKCSFSLNTNINKISFSMGSIVSFKVKDNNKWYNKFFGYIFAQKPNADNNDITAYDQLKYLTNEETYVLTNQTHESIIKKIGEDFNLRVGTLEGSSYILPERIEDAKALGDIIQRALDFTLTGTGEYYILRDEFGYITCRNVENLITNIVIGEESLLSSYDYEENIDSETSNQIKLYKDNEDTGKREIYLVKDSNNIKKWGVLQTYQSVDENMNEDQIKQRAEDMLSLYNKPYRKIDLTINGIIDLDAGNGVYLNLNNIPNSYINELFLIKKITNTYDNGILTSKLEVVY